MWFEQLRQDVRCAVRSVARNPLFALTAVLSLAAGIGADTAVFSVANSLLLRPPAGVAAPDRLVDISGRERAETFGVNRISFPNFVDLRDRAGTLDEICGYEPVAEAMSLAADGAAERIFGHRVTTNYFAVLGVRAAAGRLFDTRPREQLAGEQSVVLSHRFWSRRFNQDPGVVGQIVIVNSVPFTIAGVAAPEFEGSSLVATDVWVPLRTTPPPTSYLTQRGLEWALLRARLKPGVSVAQAAAEIDTIGRALEQQYPDDNNGKGLRLAAASSIPGNLAPAVAGMMTLLIGFVSLVLVIASANVANVLLSRALARRREIAARVAIGVGRARLMRQLLIETMLLFVAGAALGLWLARGMTSLLLWLLPALPVPLALSLDLDGRTIAFTLALSFVAAALCGLVPALQASNPNVSATLEGESMGVATSTDSSRSAVGAAC